MGHVWQELSQSRIPGIATPEMIQNAIDVGLEVNRLRKTPVGFLTISEKMTFEEMELVWPYMSTVAELMSPRTSATLCRRRKDQTEKEKKMAALLAARCRSLRHEALLSPLEALRNGTLDEGSEDAQVALKTFEVQVLDGQRLSKRDWISLKKCCEQILLVGHADDTTRKLAKNLLDALHKFVGLTCVEAWDPADRPLKTGIDTTPPSPQLAAQRGIVRGEAQGTALNSQRNWIAEQLKDTDRNLGRAASFSSSFDGSNERAGHEDVHPAVAIVAAQGHYYDQMMKLPFELLSSQIVSEELANGRLCCKPCETDI